MNSWNNGSTTARRFLSGDRLLAQSIHDPVYPIPHQGCTEIDEEAEALVHQSQVGEQLFVMNRQEPLYRFQLNDDFVSDHKVCSKALLERQEHAVLSRACSPSFPFAPLRESPASPRVPGRVLENERAQPSVMVTIRPLTRTRFSASNAIALG